MPLIMMGLRYVLTKMPPIGLELVNVPLYYCEVESLGTNSEDHSPKL